MLPILYLNRDSSPTQSLRAMMRCRTTDKEQSKCHEEETERNAYSAQDKPTETALNDDSRKNQTKREGPTILGRGR